MTPKTRALIAVQAISVVRAAFAAAWPSVISALEDHPNDDLRQTLFNMESSLNRIESYFRAIAVRAPSR